MDKISKYRLRKCSDINLDLPFFEVLDEDDTILMDISESEDKQLQILFYDAIPKKSISFELLKNIIDEARIMIDAEKE